MRDVAERPLPVRFYLGAHRPGWLATAGVPLFVSRRTLAPVRALPRALAPWALDSGGFTELSLHGAWTMTPAAYAAEVRRFAAEVGRLDFAAPMDWMCEPAILARTGLTVEEHQRRTIESYLTLSEIAPELPWIPVLQGWSISDYWRHADAYEGAGIDLAKLPLVGVGTLCRRQAMTQAGAILSTLAAQGLRLHGFGFKASGLRENARYLMSADSLAWSMNARRNPPLPGHPHKSCSNCFEWAMGWRDELVARLEAA
jgi:hypothetical protein